MDCTLPFERQEREVFIRSKSRSDHKFGSDPYDRDIDTLLDYGIININKPNGPTSHQVSAYAKQILGIKKTGHSGTLDPKVTGVLPVAIGRATRIVQTLLPAGKEYVTLMHIHDDAGEKQIRDVIDTFVGKIKQLPPVKSSVKRQWRFRKIYYIEVNDIDGRDVLFRVGCQAGTYIRKLCTDIGQTLGTGAHMADLIRTKAGPFKLDDSFTLHELRDAMAFLREGNETFIRKVIHPIEHAVDHLPKIWVHDSVIEPLSHGTNLAVPGISAVHSDIQVGEMVAIMSLKGELVAIGSTQMISRQMVKEEHGIAVTVEKVFMLPGTYPRVRRDL